MPKIIVARKPFKTAAGIQTPGAVVSAHPAVANMLIARKLARPATPEEATAFSGQRQPPRRSAPGGQRHQSGPGPAPTPREVPAPPRPTLTPAPTKAEAEAATVQLDLDAMTVDQVLGLVNGEPVETLQRVRDLEGGKEKPRKTLLEALDRAIADASTDKEPPAAA